MESYILYVSSFVKDYSTTDLDIMMKSFKENNLREGVTGVIIVSNRNVMQFIQGNKKNLQMLWSNIERDGRHKNIKVLMKGESDLILYKDWSLRYVHSTSDYDWDIRHMESTLSIQNKISNLLRNFFTLN